VSVGSCPGCRVQSCTHRGVQSYMHSASFSGTVLGAGSRVICADALLGYASCFTGVQILHALQGCAFPEADAENECERWYAANVDSCPGCRVQSDLRRCVTGARILLCRGTDPRCLTRSRRQTPSSARGGRPRTSVPVQGAHNLESSIPNRGWGGEMVGVECEKL